MTTQAPAHVPTDRVVAFDIYASPPPGIGLHQHWATLRQHGPGPSWTPLNGGHWIATQTRAILEDYASFSARILRTHRPA